MTDNHDKARLNDQDTIGPQDSPGEVFSGDASISEIPTISNHLSVLWKNKVVSAIAGASVAASLARYMLLGPDYSSWNLRLQLTLTTSNALWYANYHSKGEYLRTIVKTLKHKKFNIPPGHNPSRELNPWRNFDLRVKLHDGSYHQIDIPVCKLGLEGRLKDLDAQVNDNERLLPAEWVVHDSVDLSNSSSSSSSSTSSHHRYLLYFHGGGYAVMSPKSHRHLVNRLSCALGVRALSVEYRLCPETIFPGQLHDAMIAYSYLTKTLKIPASRIILGGDSAGGNLAVVLMTYLSDQNLPLPCATFLLSPYLDMTCSLDSWDKFTNIDYLKRSDTLYEYDVAEMFVGGPDKHELYTDPYVSPILGCEKFPQNFPPVLIQCGDLELLRDDDIFFAYKLVQSNVPTTLQVFGECVHDQQMFDYTDMAIDSMKFIKAWWDHLHPTLPSEEPYVKSTLLGDIDGTIENKRTTRPPIQPKSHKRVAVFSKNDQKSKSNIKFPQLAQNHHPLMVSRWDALNAWWSSEGQNSTLLTQEFIEPHRLRWWNKAKF